MLAGEGGEGGEGSSARKLSNFDKSKNNVFHDG